MKQHKQGSLLINLVKKPGLMCPHLLTESLENWKVTFYVAFNFSQVCFHQVRVTSVHPAHVKVS